MTLLTACGGEGNDSKINIFANTYIQPSATTYNWAILDDQLALAEQYDLEVVLAILNGSFAPAWL